MNIKFSLIHTALASVLAFSSLLVLQSADTLKIQTSGAGNQIQVDSAWFSGSPPDTIINAGTSGEIKQTGENNRVEIKTGGEAPNNKKQITNNNQKTNCKNQTTSDEQPETCNLKRATIKVKQSGNNNSVKINQH